MVITVFSLPIPFIILPISIVECAVLIGDLAVSMTVAIGIEVADVIPPNCTKCKLVAEPGALGLPRLLWKDEGFFAAPCIPSK